MEFFSDKFSQFEMEFNAKLNSRKMTEFSVEGRHVSVGALKKNLQEDDTLWTKVKQLGRMDTKKIESEHQPGKPRILDYLNNDVPEYPTPVEFHVSNVSHVTDRDTFLKILESEKIQAHRVPKWSYSWWTLRMGKEEITSAETLFSQRNEMKFKMPFLENFTNSPLFQFEKSQYGNYRFTFPLAELMGLYRDQHCGGRDPVLRVFKTMFYKQEIVYAVLIHSPEDDGEFSKFPLLEKSEFVRYVDEKIVWRAQAIASELQLTCGGLWNSIYYVWDQVCLAFHLPSGKALRVGNRRLVEAVESCRLHEVNLLWYKDLDYYFKTAQTEVEKVKKDAE